MITFIIKKILRIIETRQIEKEIRRMYKKNVQNTLQTAKNHQFAYGEPQYSKLEIINQEKSKTGKVFSKVVELFNRFYYG